MREHSVTSVHRGVGVSSNAHGYNWLIIFCPGHLDLNYVALISSNTFSIKTLFNRLLKLFVCLRDDNYHTEPDIIGSKALEEDRKSS